MQKLNRFLKVTLIATAICWCVIIVITVVVLAAILLVNILTSDRPDLMKMVQFAMVLSFYIGIISGAIGAFDKDSNV